MQRYVFNPYLEASNPAFGGPADQIYAAQQAYLAAMQNAQNQAIAAQAAALNAGQAGAGTMGMVPGAYPGFPGPAGFGCGGPGDCGQGGLGVGLGSCGGYGYGYGVPGLGWPGYPGGFPGLGCGPMEAAALANQLSPDQLARMGFGPCNIRDSARGRMGLFGWDSAAGCNPPIQPGSTVTLTNTAQSTFMIKGIDVTNNIAEWFAASSIKVGNTELLLTSGNISLAVFKSDSCFDSLKSCVASPGVEVSITVTNRDSVPHHFLATIRAEELPPGRCP